MRKLFLLITLLPCLCFSGVLDTERQRECMALNIYHEARGEPFIGWLSVAFVTINRVESERFPDSICEVVWQHRQFEWTQDEYSDKPLDKKAWQAVLVFTNGFLSSYEYIEDPTRGADHYHSNIIKPYWANSMLVTAVVGKHLFYKQIP